MKIFKNKNFKALIYSFFLALPIFAIFGRVIYTQSNKNAKDSYYGETINEEIDTFVNVEDLENGNTYLFENYTITIPQTQNINQFTYIYVLNVQDLKGNLLNPQNIDYFVFYYSSNNYPINRVYYKDTTSRDYNLNNDFLNFSFKIRTTINLNVNPFLYENNFFYTREYNKYSYLDNAFEYSIDKFTQDNNFGNLNFFQWFSDLFLNNNQTNNLYIHFVNWYMNYILYVSLAYLLFAVLMWFVNFFRSLVEKNMDLDL